MGDQKVKVRIEADARQADREIKQVTSRFDRLRSAGKALRAHWLSLTAATTGLVLAFKAVISASAQQELAVRKLDAALSPLGARAAAVSKELQAQAAALQEVTMHGDETIIAGQALLASFTKNKEEIKKATTAALDLSAATGVNLQSAFLLLGRAATGEISMLSRYGIMLDESIPKTEKFGAALDFIAEKWGGQAQEQAKTFTGQLAQLSNVFGDLNEKMGDAITQNKEALAALTKTKEAVRGLQDEARAAGVVVALFSSSLLQTGDLSQAFVLTLAKMAKGLFDTSEAAEDASNAIEETGNSAEDAKAGVEDLTQSLKDLADAYEKAAENTKALGETTSVQLGAQIIKINQELYDQGLILGKNSTEYKRLAEIAGEKIAGLTARIEALRSGQGDLKESTEEAGDAFKEYSRELENAEINIEALTESANRGTAALKKQQEQVILTTREFDALAASAGRAAAVEAALAGGARIGMGGTRVYLPGGGSRLVSGAGLGGNFFNPEKRSVVMPDGRIIFI